MMRLMDVLEGSRGVSRAFACMLAGFRYVLKDISGVEGGKAWKERNRTDLVLLFSWSFCCFLLFFSKGGAWVESLYVFSVLSCGGFSLSRSYFGLFIFIFIFFLVPLTLVSYRHVFFNKRSKGNETGVTHRKREIESETDRQTDERRR